MNSPRIRLSRLTSDQPVQDANGSPPRVRLRQPTAAGSSKAKRGGRRWLSPLPVAGIVLVLIALVGYLSVYAASSKRTQILLATHALPAGTVLSASDLRTAGIAGEPSLLSSLLPARDASQVVGRRLSAAVPAGAPVPAGALAANVQAQAAAFTLAAPEFDVIGERLQPGDRVSVLATFGAGSGSASTRPIARNLEVLSVGEAPVNADPSTATVPVTLALGEPAGASELALANQDAKIDVLLEGSGGSSAAIPQVSQGGTP
jgi:Flp pilus assembly protein CpaB